MLTFIQYLQEDVRLGILVWEDCQVSVAPDVILGADLLYHPGVSCDPFWLILSAVPCVDPIFPLSALCGPLLEMICDKTVQLLQAFTTGYVSFVCVRLLCR